ncbi:MAG: hypothetical protein R3F54_20955 [Alphaproteobacteria bacterium]
MNGGHFRRSPKTARAMPQPEPKIEREKIRHRRPNDMRLDDGQAPAAMPSLVTEEPDGTVYDDRAAGYEGHASRQEEAIDPYRDDTPHQEDPYQDDADLDWTVQPSETAQPSEEEAAFSAWDEESEENWELSADFDDGEESGFEQFPAEDDEDDGGVIWGDDALADPALGADADEIAFGAAPEKKGTAPEVELAGRRDVRPKRPRPGPASRPQGTDRQAGRRRPAARQPQSPPDMDWSAPAEPEIEDPRIGQGFAEPPRPPIDRAPPPRETDPLAEPLPERDLERGHFSRPRPIAEVAAPRVAGGDSVLQPPRSAAPVPRRRQAKIGRASSSTGRFSSMPLHQRLAIQQRRPGKAIIALTLLTLLLVGGWFAFESGSADGLGPLIDRVISMIPIPGSSRTAADTSFGDQDIAETVTPEEALSDLETRIREQNGDVATPAQTAPDPATIRVDGPPLPVFKPLSGQTTRSLPTSAQTAPTPAADRAELAENGGDSARDEGSEPSIFEQLWRYINPG